MALRSSGTRGSAGPSRRKCDRKPRNHVFLAASQFCTAVAAGNPPHLFIEIQAPDSFTLYRRETTGQPGKHKIVIVHEETSLRRVLLVSLTALLKFGASTGEQALAAPGAEYHDLVLLDVNMPGVGGVETCKRIQELSPRPAVVMLTVRHSQADKAQAFEAGATDYLPKPCQMRDLIACVRSVLSRPMDTPKSP